MATGSISTLGIGSGLDLQDMLTQLKEVDQQPIEKKKSTVENLEAQIEEFDSIKSTLLSMRTSALDLSLGSNFLATETTATGSAIEVTSNAGAKDMSHSVNVESLASFSSWTSEGMESKAAIITSEDMTFSFKLGEEGNTITLDVDAGTTLQDLVTMINDDESNPGITASIADTGFGDNPFKLVLRSDESGEENRIFIESQLEDPPPTSDNGVTVNGTNTLEITSALNNNEIVFQERLADGSLGAETTATIADGTYTSGADLAAAMESAMESASENGIDYTVSYDQDTEKFSIQENGAELHELNISWGNSSAASALGFNGEDDVWKPHAGLQLTESTGAGFKAPESDNKVYIDTSTPATISAANTNNEIVFRERLSDGSLGTGITATIADGSYTSGDDLATAIETAMETASTNDGNGINYSVLYDSETKKFTIMEDGAKLNELQINWGSSSAALALGFDAETDSYTPYEASLNAKFTVDNISYQRQSNDDIDDVIQGITLNLKEPGSVTIGVEPNFEEVETAVQSLIDNFNTLKTNLDEKSTFDVDSGEKGLLFGKNAITRIDNELKNFFEQDILGLNGSVNSMSDLGLSVNGEGKLSLDISKFNEALSQNSEDVIKFFTGDSDKGIEGFGDQLYDKMKTYTGIEGLITSETEANRTRITKLEDQIENDTTLLNKRYDTLTMQFIEMDSFMQQMQSQANFMDQMLNSQKKDD